MIKHNIGTIANAIAVICITVIILGATFNIANAESQLQKIHMSNISK